MKKIIVFITLLFSVSANAITYYNAPGHALPDEMSPTGLPEVIPCATRKTFEGKVAYECIWLSTSRELRQWDYQQNKEVRFYNQQDGKCQNGRCFAGGVQVGGIPQDVSYIRVSRWYYIWLSRDGKVVAHLTKTGPAYDGDEVTYVAAAETLQQFYIDSGLNDAEIVHELDLRVDGGYASVVKTDSPAQKITISGDIKEAWCNPRMDDDCSINGQKVPVAELGKYLPALDPSEVEASGGTCEYPICYDANYKPVGIRR